MEIYESEKQIAFFASLCFFLSVLEYAIPKPVPFFRLGLANLPIMLSLSKMSKKQTLFLAILKIFAQAIFSGTLFSYVFLLSFAGTVSSTLAMMIVYSVFSHKFISFVGVSVVGGFFNNAAQILISYFFILGKSVRFIAPFMFAATLVTSICLGIFAICFEQKSEWYNALKISAQKIKISEENFIQKEHKFITRKNIFDVFFVLCSICAFLIVSFSKKVFQIYIIFFVFFILSIIRKRNPKILPLVFMIFFTTLLSIFFPYGKILLSIGKFHITAGAISSGLLRSGKLCASVCISQVALPKDFQFCGKIGFFISEITKNFSLLTKNPINLYPGKIISEIDERLKFISDVNL